MWWKVKLVLDAICAIIMVSFAVFADTMGTKSLCAFFAICNAIDFYETYKKRKVNYGKLL